MEVKKVYICVNEGEFTMEFVKRELEEEGYTHSFGFRGDLVSINDCDEFWCFGNCEEKESYKKAVELGVDIWRMA